MQYHVISWCIPVITLVCVFSYENIIKLDKGSHVVGCCKLISVCNYSQGSHAPRKVLSLIVFISQTRNITKLGVVAEKVQYLAGFSGKPSS